MIYIRIFFCLMALASVTLTQAAAEEMDEIAVNENPPGLPIFEKFFPIGRTANTHPNADLVLWKAESNPPKIHIHIVSGYEDYIKYLKRIVKTDKIELNDKQKPSTIKDLIDIAGKKYTARTSDNKHLYAMRIGDIQNIKRVSGSAEWNDEKMEEGLFISCPKRADIAVKLMNKYPAKGDHGNFSIEHFETLLKKDGYYGPYVIVQEEKALVFLQALGAIVQTGKSFTTEWAAVKIPQKSIFEQAREFFFD